MKIRNLLLNNLVYVVIAALTLTACQNLDRPPFSDFEIDPSVLQINYPPDGTAIRLYDEPASIDIEFQVDDDHVVDNITIDLDGNEVAVLTDFENPRFIVETYTLTGVTFGEHVLTITSTDIEGQSTVAQVTFTKEPPYIPELEGEVFYMPFEEDYREQVSGRLATQVGSPGFAGEGRASQNAYKGAPDSYLTLPADGLTNPEFSATFWIKTNDMPNRAGILTMSPVDEANPGNQNNRSSGFRLFREDVGGNQVLKLNIGSDGDRWFDGGANAALPIGQWAHVAISIGATEAAVYINGQVVSSGEFPGLDWTGIDLLSIASGAPRFVQWGHLSEESPIDELKIFDRALSAEDIIEIAGLADPYMPQYAGESFYMPFDGNFLNLVANAPATVVGSPEITENSYEGSGAYNGAPDSYLTYPSEGLLTPEFSASFWINTNATPNRAGILAISPEDTENPDNPNNRSSGFRLFREDVGGNQVLKLNIGSGGDNWFDGGAAAALPIGEWAHVVISIGADEAAVYINGEVVSQGSFPGLDWTGTDLISIGSGAPRFIGWGHLSEESLIDELRFFTKELSTEEVGAIFGGEVYNGSTFYMPFEGTYKDRISNTEATVVGSPDFAGEGRVGADAYAGAEGSYLTFPTDGLTTSEFSATMWIKLNDEPNRAGILTISPEDLDNANYPDTQNDRSSGFRLFREDVGGNQVLKLNIGSGGDNWFDGGAAAAIPVGEWAHLAISISETDAAVYINGEVVSSGAFAGLDWTGTEIISIMSGAPRFTEWGHLSDQSILDELYFFDKALTQSEIQAIIGD